MNSTKTLQKQVETEEREILAAQMTAVAVATVVVAGKILEFKGELISELFTSAAGADTLSESAGI